MFSRSMFLLNFAVRFFLLEVTAVDISVSPNSLNEGATLTITCTEQSLSQSATLYSLALQKATDDGVYDTVLTYDVNLINPAGGPYLPSWGNNLGDLQQRANFTPTFGADRTSLSFEFRIYSVKCNDAASFRCRRTASGNERTVDSNAQNVTIHGVTQSIEITGAQDCTTFTDPNCAQCHNFDDGFGVQPKYARMGQPLVLTCAGLMATPTSQNKAIWYKQSLNDQQKRIIDMNTTELVYDSPSPNSCSVPGRSTLTYYPKPTDCELRITCEITGGMSVDTVSEEMSICVEGLIYVGNPVRSGVTQSIEITGAQDCTTATDPDCAQCRNFDDRFGDQPKYARMGQPLVLTCAGQMATPTSQNKAIWYRQNLHDPEKVILTVNTTELLYDPPSPNACSVTGRSTLTYYPQPTDRELRITCEITGGMSVDTVSEEMSICVEGLIYIGNPVRSDVKDCESCEPMGMAGLRYGGGQIAGAVLGGACGGALVALLISFIILRCTGYTLMDSKEQLRTEPRRSAQQSDPSRHHSSPPSASPGYYNMQQDHTALPGYYNVQQDHTDNAPYQLINHAAQPAPSHYETMNRTNVNDDGYLELRQ